jgi:hypothetical protein
LYGNTNAVLDVLNPTGADAGGLVTGGMVAFDERVGWLEVVVVDAGLLV